MARLLYSDYKALYPAEQLYELYIQQNLSVRECCIKTKLSQTTLMRLLKDYGIKKSQEAHVANIKKSKLESHGNPNFNNRPKADQTNLDRYGVKNQFQRKDLFPQIYEKKVQCYGTYNNMEKNFATRAEHYGSVKASYEAQQKTYAQTCAERYGETNSAKVKEIRAKIKNSVAETFMERYGVENYWTSPNAKLSHQSKNSSANLAFAEKLEQANIRYSTEFSLAGKRFDFKVGNFLIEINPTATHNSTWGIHSQSGLDKNYHKLKSNVASVNGFQCLHLFDWESADLIIEFLKEKQPLYARKCNIRQLSPREAYNFLTAHHLQGYVKDSVRLGLYYNNNIVAVMTFGKPRFNKNYEYELLRYCSPIYKIIGGAEKLFANFLKTYNPASIVSYCDLSKFSGQVYKKLGFSLVRNNAPSKHWYNLKAKRHITDNLLRQKGFDKLFHTNFGKGTSNEALMLEAGFVEIYDCGQATYIWKAK